MTTNKINEDIQNFMDNAERLLKPSEVASIFRISPKTVGRWAKEGKLNKVSVNGAQGRYRMSEVKALIDSQNA